MKHEGVYTNHAHARKGIFFTLGRTFRAFIPDTTATMTTEGLQRITDKFLDRGQLFGIRFNEGIVFLEVTGWEQVKYSPYNQHDEVAAQQGTGFQRLEHDGDDILFTEKRKKKVKHVAIGHSPAILRRYTNYPEGETRLRKLEYVGTPNAGDDYGYVDGEDSPYSSPTDAEELCIPPGVHLNFNFYNPDNKPHNPVANIVMRQYNIRALDPSRDADAKSIRRILSPGSPMPIFNAGSVDRQINYQLEQFWGVSPISRNDPRVGGGV